MSEALFQNITLGQIAVFVAFVGALYGGVKYLKKELKEAITEIATVYKKVNGAWVVQSDVTNVFQSGVNYKQG